MKRNQLINLLINVKFNGTSNKIYTDPNDYLNKLEMNRSKLLDEIKNQSLNKQKSQKKQYDKHINDRKIFKINDFGNYYESKTCETKKYNRNWEGLYRVIEIMNSIDYKLEHVQTNKQTVIHYN